MNPRKDKKLLKLWLTEKEWELLKRMMKDGLNTMTSKIIRDAYKRGDLNE